jgi:hypothetical protein
LSIVDLRLAEKPDKQHHKPMATEYRSKSHVSARDFLWLITP